MNATIKGSNLALSQLASSKHKARQAEKEKWAAIWFAKLCEFTKVPRQNDWNYSAEQVIAFLRHRIVMKDPAWKRLKVIQALILFRQKHPVVGPADLKFIEVKLKEISATERVKKNHVGSDGDSTHAGVKQVELKEIDIVGKINPREPDLIQQMRRKLRLMGRGRNTEKVYINWVKRFLVSRGVRSIEECQAVDQADVETFLTDLVVDGNVAASTQDQAFYALLYLFEHILKRKLANIDALRSTKPKLRPTVMSADEVGKVLEQMGGRYLLIAQLLYGSGMRISEVLRLRVKDLDFDQHLIVVNCSKGKKSRFVPMPAKVVDCLTRLLEDRRRLHEQDVCNGEASVWLPNALDRKFVNAHREFKWQFLFASARHSKDPKTGRRHRHHLHGGSFSSGLRKAVERSGILKYVTAHTFRHSFATSLLRAGSDIRVVQELLGHADVSTTMIYTHVLMDERSPVVSPLDQMVAV